MPTLPGRYGDASRLWAGLPEAKTHIPFVASRKLEALVSSFGYLAVKVISLYRNRSHQAR